jgi:hypothetical protein
MTTGTPRANIGPIIDGQNRLRQDFKLFAQKWVSTKEDWRDSRREQFEREHLQSIGPSLARLSAALDQWRDFVTQADRELEDKIAE